MFTPGADVAEDRRIGGDWEFDDAAAYYRDLVYRYARSEFAVDEAVSRFVAPIRSAFSQPESPASRIEELLWAAWPQVIGVAVESADGRQEKIVDLLSAIRRQGALTRDHDGRECRVWGLRVYDDLPIFAAEMREDWDAFDDQPDAWLNMNTFAALLTAAGIDFSLYALWSMRDCLEERTVRPVDVLAVAQWFRHCGSQLESLTVEPPPAWDRLDKLTEAGPLARDHGVVKPWFTPQRWNYWHSRLHDLTTESADVAAAAREALDYLERASKGNAQEP